MPKATQESEQKVIALLTRLIEKRGPWLSLSDAQQRYGVSVQTLHSAVRDGRMPALKLPGQTVLIREVTIKNGIGLRKKPALQVKD